MKVAQAEDQEARKKWVKQQPVPHTYGNDQEDDDAEEDEVDPALIITAGATMEEIEEDDGALLVISGRICQCGSKTHKRVSQPDCPLKPKIKTNSGFYLKEEIHHSCMLQSERGFFGINFNPIFDFRVSFAASYTVAIENRLFYLFTSSLCIKYDIAYNKH